MRLNLFRQLRLVVIVVSGVGVIAIVVALLVAYRSETLQREFLNNIVLDEYNELLEHLELYPDAPLPSSSQLVIWMDGHPASDPVPSQLKQLPMGYHHDIPVREDVYHIYKTTAQIYITYVAIETSSFSNRERWMQGALIGVALLDIPIAFLMGIWLVRRIALPHEQLAARVSELEPGGEPVHISQYFRGQEVARIAEAIDNYQDRLRGFIERERSFTAAASHELRTPLAAILTSAEVLQHDSRLDPQLQAYTARLIRAAQDLGQLLDGLMWMAREKDPPKQQTIDVLQRTNELAEQIATQNKPIKVMDERPADQKIEPSLPAALFDIVVGNLLRNGWQFSPVDEPVLAYITGSGLRIENQGPVISSAELEHIFECYYRSQSSPGQGLGLYIANTICTRLGWQLKVESNATTGTSVELLIEPA